MDYPVSAGTKGSLMFLNGVTDEMLQAYRDKVFQVCKQDLVDVTAKLVNHQYLSTYPVRNTYMGYTYCV